jgi:hypothetical protein
VRGRACTVLNYAAAAGLTFETINIAWPRNTDLPWWQNWAFVIGMAAFGLLGLAYFLTRRPDRQFGVGGAAMSGAAEAAAAVAPAPAPISQNGSAAYGEREPAQT